MINWILRFTRLGYLKIFDLHHLPTALIQAKARPGCPEENKSQVKTGKLGRSLTKLDKVDFAWKQNHVPCHRWWVSKVWEPDGTSLRSWFWLVLVLEPWIGHFTSPATPSGDRDNLFCRFERLLFVTTVKKGLYTL